MRERRLWRPQPVLGNQENVLDEVHGMMGYLGVIARPSVGGWTFLATANIPFIFRLHNRSSLSLIMIKFDGLL